MCVSSVCMCLVSEKERTLKKVCVHVCVHVYVRVWTLKTRSFPASIMKVCVCVCVCV